MKSGLRIVAALFVLAILGSTLIGAFGGGT
jgi:hypothetical protein